MKILVIDDDDIARELVASTLRHAGHEVLELPSAIGATKVIYHSEVDAVVLDVMLPDLDGDKLARLLRQNSRGKHLAIVLMSSRPTEELELLAYAASADAVVNKREIRQRLVSVVTHAYTNRRRAAANLGH